jgi:predicted RNase H-like HicB family nuclease
MNRNVQGYRVTIEPLSEEDGGGFMASAPDLEGCMSDGATPEEALHNIYDAILCWLDAADDRETAGPARRYA